MITVFGRPDSSAVARVMWTVGELGLAHERRDWGGAFGGNDDPEYRAMVPSGKIPGVRLADGRTLWESNAIIRYLCSQNSTSGLLPDDPFERAHVEAWMDWAGAYQLAVNAIRKAYKPAATTPDIIAKAVQDAAPVLAVLNTRLTGRDYVMGDAFTAADIALGVWSHRLWRCPQAARPDGIDAIWAWIDRLQARPAYQDHVMAKVSAGPQSIGGG